MDWVKKKTAKLKAQASNKSTRRRHSKSLRSTSSRRATVATVKTQKTKKNPTGISATSRRRPKAKLAPSDTESTVEGSAARAFQNPQLVINAVNRDKPNSESQKRFYLNFVRQVFELGVDGILKQYDDELRAYIPPNFTRCAFDQNPKKNRYSDVICLDASRVKLRDWPTDYIHANYVKTAAMNNSGFICTQGPLRETVRDFWQMVYQERATHIVMLCETVELGKEKCQQYWPRKMGETIDFSGFRVRNMSVDDKDSVTVVSLLELVRVLDRPRNHDFGPPLYLRHYLWKNWPDRGVPSSVLAPFRILANARRAPSHCIVHCSAGIGRTGTFVAIEACLQMLLLERPLNVAEVVKEMRSMRVHSVQTDIQFLFTYKCLVSYAIARGVVTQKLGAAARKFNRDYNFALVARAANFPILPPRTGVPDRRPN